MESLQPIKMLKDNWSIDPFPYAIIDNFLPSDEFESLNYELNQTSNLIQRQFETPLERKAIYTNILSKENAQGLIYRMASDQIKDIISQQIGLLDIVSMGEKLNFAGYSPYHITRNEGYLGSHVDHSSIENGKLRHIANTIYYVSSKWEKGWGGQTILFSRNGFCEKVLIDPIPNRLIVFIHTANSFHGVRKYYSPENIERRTFYHDYYVKESKINLVMQNINININSKLVHSLHPTTFIPFFPFGIFHLNYKAVFSFKNLNYIPTYIVYLVNRYFGTRISSIRKMLNIFG